MNMIQNMISRISGGENFSFSLFSFFFLSKILFFYIRSIRSHRDAHHEVTTQGTPVSYEYLSKIKKSPQQCVAGISLLSMFIMIYIMPPMPGAPPIGICGSGAGLSQITDSVVRKRPAIEAAFSRATRDTLAGSMIPAFFMSS